MSEIFHPGQGSTTRSGSLVVPSSSATGSELKNIERALMHPPKKVDWVRSVLSALTAIALGVKAGADFMACQDAPRDNPSAFMSVVLMSVALLMFGFVVHELVLRLTEKHPFHDAALEDVKQLIREQSGAPMEDASKADML